MPRLGKKKRFGGRVSWTVFDDSFNCGGEQLHSFVQMQKLMNSPAATSCLITTSVAFIDQLLYSMKHSNLSPNVILILILKPNPKPLKERKTGGNKLTIHVKAGVHTIAEYLAGHSTHLITSWIWEHWQVLLTRFFRRADSSFVSEENLTKAVPRSGLSRLMKLLPNLSRAWA